jgi:hypothetical protein
MNEGTHPMDKRVLAVGHSRRVLSNLTRALTEAGFDAQWTTDAAAASQRFQPHSVDLVAFGRGVSSADRSRLRSDFLQGNPAVLFVDGLAPITPLLIAQVQAAFSSQPQQARVLEHLASSDGHLTIAIRDDCDVEVTVYRLDRLYRTHTATPLAQRITRGSHAIPLGHQSTGRGLRFAVVRINTTEVSIVSL